MINRLLDCGSPQCAKFRIFQRTLKPRDVKLSTNLQNQGECRSSKSEVCSIVATGGMTLSSHSPTTSNVASLFSSFGPGVVWSGEHG